MALYLMSAHPRDRDCAQELWGVVVDLALSHHDVDGFTLDATPPMEQSGGRTAGVSAASRMGEGDGQLMDLPTQTAEDLIQAGLTALTLDLYSRASWVCGISDWGDEIDALLDEETIGRLRTALSKLGDRVTWDIEEARDRPMFKPTRP